VISIIGNDDETGVLASQISHVTQRGVRLDTAESGSGLWFAIVWDILEANGGEIRPQNSAGRGLSAIATFRVAPQLNAKDET